MDKVDWNTMASMWLCPAWWGKKSLGEEPTQDAALAHGLWDQLSRSHAASPAW